MIVINHPSISIIRLTVQNQPKKNGGREFTGVIYEMQRCCDRKLGQVKGSADTDFKFDMCVFHINGKHSCYIIMVGRVA
jgi:hypothetical protein